MNIYAVHWIVRCGGPEDDKGLLQDVTGVNLITASKKKGEYPRKRNRKLPSKP